MEIEILQVFLCYNSRNVDSKKANELLVNFINYTACVVPSPTIE